MVRATGQAGADPVQVTLARERSDRLQVLRVMPAICCWRWAAALLATLLGYVIVNRSMRRLRSVVAKANDISTSRMNTRLSVQDAPVELRELGEAFNAMLNRLEDGVQRLSGFAADLAHDMRTPLNTLMMETRWRCRAPHGGGVSGAAGLQLRGVRAAVAHDRQHAVPGPRRQCPAGAEARNAGPAVELQRIHDYFEFLAEDVGVRLSVEAEPLRASVDPVLLQRAVSNLMANAIAHTPAGGTVTLSARGGRGRRDRRANTGPGIEPAHLAAYFRPLLPR
jgi:two-component system heavy metal sensor histidine kinase CusS